MGGESGVPAIPHCRSLSLLGERSAGTLYAADSDRYGGAVTVTVYARPADDLVRQRFEAAVDTARRLGAHPNLVTIHASGHTDDDGRPYVVSDGHDRTTAAGVLATSGVLGVDSVLPIGVALAGGLETAHRAGMVHGGVAPGLILLRADGQPVLTEVGLYEFARPQGASAHLARWIPYHAPPEILEGTEVTPATDVYALASVVYTLLVGQPPYAGSGVDDSTASLLLRILQMPVPRIERSDVPPGLEDALRSALSHSPAKRPQHPLELAWAMQDAQRTAGSDVTEPFVMDLGSGGLAAPAGGAPTGGAAGGLALGSGTLPAPATPGAPGAPSAPGATPSPAGGIPSSPYSGVPDNAATGPYAGGPPNGTTGPYATGGAPGNGNANGHDGGSIGSMPNGYGSDVAGPRGGAPVPRREAGPGSLGDGPFGGPPAGPTGPTGPTGRDGPAGALPRRGTPSGNGTDSPQTTTPWWATPPFGTTAVSGSPVPATPAGDGSPGPLSPLVGRDPLGGVGGSRPSPLDAPALHQPLPTDSRPPIDTRSLGEAFEPGRAPLPNRPAVPQARQAPASTTPAPSPPARRRHRQDGDAGEPGHPARDGDAGTADGTSRRSRRHQARNRSGPGNEPAEGRDGRSPAATSPTTTAPRASAGTTTRTAGIGTGAPAGPDDRAMSALERARQARLERQQRERAGGTATVPGTRTRPEVSSEPAPGRRPIGATPEMAAPRSGPPALPVIVLLALVLVLGLAGAWLVITGEDGPEPASEADQAQDTDATPTTADGAPPGQAATAPNRASDLTATETDAGVQLDWEGPEGAVYLVRILSPSEPPRPLGAGPATALLIPPDLVQAGGAYCFDVVAAPAEGEPPATAPGDTAQAAIPTACIGGANPEAVIRP